MSEDKKSLPVLVSEMHSILAEIINAEGELTPELEAMFDSVSSDLAIKADGYAFFMDRLKNEADFWKAKADGYYKVSQSCKNLRERLNDSIKNAMRVLDKTEIEGNDMRFVLSKLENKISIDERLLPENYKIIHTQKIVDRERVKEHTKAGIEIPGVTQDAVFGLRKYINSKKGK